MNSRRRVRLLTLGILFATAVTNISFAQTNRPAVSKADYTVALRFGKETALTQKAVQTLYSEALELLETSNFNSPSGVWQGGSIAQVQEHYRQTISGKYLLVSLKESQKIMTAGGEVIVREIVIGLNRPDCIAIVEGVSYADYASSLFTIDDEGRIVEHSKYSGPTCIELMKLVKRIAGEA